MVVQSGPSLTGVAGYSEHHSICFTALLLLQDITDNIPVISMWCLFKKKDEMFVVVKQFVRRIQKLIIREIISEILPET